MNPPNKRSSSSIARAIFSLPGPVDQRRRPIASAIIGRHSDGREGLHRPDFALIAQHGHHVTAVGVELTLKNRTRLERILRGYLRNQNVSVVRYHANPSIADAVRRAARAAGADRIVEVAPLPSIAASTIESRS